MSANQTSGDNETDWIKVFTDLSADRRRKLFEHAARRAAAANANPNEKETSLRQLQAALAVDAVLAYEVIASVQGDRDAQEKIDRLETELATARADFENLTTPVLALRAGIVEAGIIAKDSPLPAVAAEWVKAFDAVLKNKGERANQELELRKRELDDMKIKNKRHFEEMEIKTKHRWSEWENQLLRLQPRMEKRQQDILEYERMQPPGGLLSRFFGFLPHALVLDAAIAQAKRSVDALYITSWLADYHAPGERIPGEGIFTRYWVPKLGGKSLNFECEVYAAPEDLYVDHFYRYAARHYSEVVRAVAGIRDWHGQDG